MPPTSPKTHRAPDELAAYAAAWKRRAREGKEEERRRVEKAMAEARRAAELLAERYGVTRVLLFGSLVSKRRFRPESDIDLAVEGLAPKRFFTADAELAWEISFPVHLQVLSDFPPESRERIEREGVVLHGAAILKPARR